MKFVKKKFNFKKKIMRFYDIINYNSKYLNSKAIFLAIKTCLSLLQIKNNNNYKKS